MQRCWDLSLAAELLKAGNSAKTLGSTAALGISQPERELAAMVWAVKPQRGSERERLRMDARLCWLLWVAVRVSFIFICSPTHPFPLWQKAPGTGTK